MNALLPPSSRPTGLAESAASFMMRLPVEVSPVKPILATPGWTTMASPTVSPGPTMTLTAPAGIPASRVSSARRSVVSGATDGGLTTQVLPVMSAAAIFHTTIRVGKFHGVIRPITPSGSFTVMEWAQGPTGSVSPVRARPTPAKYSNVSAHCGRSKNMVLRIGEPCCAVSSAASSSVCSATIRLSLSSALARSLTGRAAQSFPASFAAATALSTSADVHFVTWPMTCPFAGLMTSKVSPLEPSTHSPPMNVL